MSISLPPSFLRVLTNAVSSLKAAEGKAPVETGEAAPVSAPEAGAATGFDASFTDGFEQVSEQQQQWAAKFAASPVIQQTKDTDCGAAATAILAGVTGKPSAASPTDLMNSLDSRFASKEGTTPKQFTDMLAHEGMAATKGASTVDAFALDEALSQGKKAAVMLDSSKLESGGASQEPGRAHWVVLDGKDEKGNYSVKDPGTGSNYSVGVNELSDAVNTGWREHNSGGMLIVEKAEEGANEGAVAEKSGQNSLLLGNKPGGGSNTRASSGRESS